MLGSLLYIYKICSFTTIQSPSRYPCCPSSPFTFLRTCCSLAEWILTCLRSELGSVYRLVQPGIWQAYGFCGGDRGVGGAKTQGWLQSLKHTWLRLTHNEDDTVERWRAEGKVPTFSGLRRREVKEEEEEEEKSKKTGKNRKDTSWNALLLNSVPAKHLKAFKRVYHFSPY